MKPDDIPDLIGTGIGNEVVEHGQDRASNRFEAWLVERGVGPKWAAAIGFIASYWVATR